MNLIPLTVSLTLAATIGISYLQTSQDEPQIINYRAGLLEFQDQAKQMDNHLQDQTLGLEDHHRRPMADSQVCNKFNKEVFTQLFPKDIKGSVNFSGNYCEIVKLSIQAEADQNNIAIFSNLLQAAQASAISANSIVDNQHIHWFVHRDHKKIYQSNLKNRLHNCVTCTLGEDRDNKIVDGGWSDWSKCDTSNQKTRICNNPVLENGGLNCQPLGLNTRACTMYDNHHTITKALAEDHKPFNINDVFGREIDKTKSVKITIAADAVLIAPSTQKCALQTGTGYTGGLTIINKGKVYGHGGDGGDGGIANTNNRFAEQMGQDGKNGGPAICVQTDITLNNQGTIAGGGGGGGGGGAAFHGTYSAGGSGGGGGQPLGKGGAGGDSVRASPRPRSGESEEDKTRRENDYPHGKRGKPATKISPGESGKNGVNSSKGVKGNDDRAWCKKKWGSLGSCARGGKGGQGGEAGKDGDAAAEDVKAFSADSQGYLYSYPKGSVGSAGCKFYYSRDDIDGEPHTVIQQ